jgi:hypothetical protein
VSVTLTPTPTNTQTPTPSVTNTLTPTPSVTNTLTPTPTNTLTPTPTSTSVVSTPTPTPTPTATSGGGLDPDATTYINAVLASGGTLSTPQRAAINTFFVGLKTDGTYNKFYYLHLFFGGTAGSNAINAKNPGTYNLSFQGTWTHSVTGSTTTQNDLNYAESGFVVSSSSPSTTETDFSFGYMMSDRNLPVSAYQYQGIGTSTSDYMIIGHDWIQADGITNFWSTLGGNNLLSAGGKTGVWNSVSRSGATDWYVAALFNGGDISTGLTKSSLQTSTFTPSSTPYDINLFRVNGLNVFTIGGNALLNYASTYLSPTEIDSFAQRANTLQLAFNRNIYPINTAPISVSSQICGGSTITGDTFSVTFNGITYPLNTAYSATSLSTVLPIAYPAPGNIYDIQFNIDPDFELCATGLPAFNRIKYIVGPSVGSGLWSSTTELYSATTLVYQDNGDFTSVQGSPYSGYGQNYTVELSLGGYNQFYVRPKLTWTPAQITGLNDWWTSTSGVNLTGSNVDSWSGYNGNLFIPYNASNKALYTASDSNWASNPSITINPTNAGGEWGYKAPTNITTASTISTFVVARNNTLTDEKPLLLVINPGAGVRVASLWRTAGGNTLWGFGYDGVNNLYNSLGVSDVAPSYIFNELVYNNSSSQYDWYASNTSTLGSVKQTMTGVSNKLLTEIQIGTYFGVLGSLNFSVVEVISINGLISGGDLTNLQNYINLKYGI